MHSRLRTWRLPAQGMSCHARISLWAAAGKDPAQSFGIIWRAVDLSG